MTAGPLEIGWSFKCGLTFTGNLRYKSLALDRVSGLILQKTSAIGSPFVRSPVKETCYEYQPPGLDQFQ